MRKISYYSPKIAPLHKFVKDLTEKYKELQALHEEALKGILEKDKQIQRLELIEHQYQQLQRLVYVRSCEKTSTTPGQLLLELESEMLEACHINDGQKVFSHTRYKAEKQKHPGRNQIPAHIPRKYVDMHAKNLSEDAALSTR